MLFLNIQISESTCLGPLAYLWIWRDKLMEQNPLRVKVMMKDMNTYGVKSGI